MIFGFTSCENASHEHTFSTEWTSDETHHWHAATCGDTDEEKDKAAHTPGEWITVTEATEEDDGSEKTNCTVCGKEYTRTIQALGHSHTIATEWSSDETNHWHAASCERAEHNTDTAEHTEDNGTVTKEPTAAETGEKEYKCTVCQKVLRTKTIPKTIICSATDVVTKIEAIPEGETRVVKVTGSSLNGIKSALKSLTGGQKVELDLSETTLTSMGNNAFEDCKSLTSVVLPEGVTSIGNYAFYGCSSLTSVEIPSSVTSIGKTAFRDCTALTSVEIPSSVTSIGARAFNSCTGLTSIEIPEGVTSIGESAFWQCRNLESVTVLATTPPNLVCEEAWHPFAYNKSGRKFYVPDESVEAYKAAAIWSIYASNILGISEKPL